MSTYDPRPSGPEDEEDDNLELTQKEWADEKKATMDNLFPDEDSEEGFNWTQD
ncbi:hypothetical protein [Hymenobacter canadensis]|uniref:Uncharacterized protein n=1 Tax=Hymenobacter canadensis TaxID=2999067 RepID=A0ABY7LU79_9BACT|nr:hypothetical protein [Hymenobacter canadensis]WBA43164.1 hypothetical protein O3303_06265 [Hymenobacter canadensis]